MTAHGIVWIDDNPMREQTASDIGAKFINVRDNDLAAAIEPLFEAHRGPRLVILDHVLDKTATANPLFRKGSTIAEAIKERWPTCPVVGVTSGDHIRATDFRTRQAYDEFFPFEDFGSHIEQIDAIRRGFATIFNAHIEQSTDILSLLRPPQDEKDRLAATVPDDLNRFVRDASVASRLYRWVRHLLDRPGFLYDSLWAATSIGLNRNGFGKHDALFTKALYRGVFQTASDRRWWANSLTRILYSHVDPRAGETPWEAGRRLPGIKKKDSSVCFVCRGDYPETVAFLDSESHERHPMHLRCTVSHPGYRRELYFEDIRMMKGT